MKGRRKGRGIVKVQRQQKREDINEEGGEVD